MAYSGRQVQFQDISVHLLNPRNLFRVDWWLPIIALSLAVVGWFLMYSAARSTNITYFNRQILFFFLGIAPLALFVCVDYRFFVGIAPLLYTAALALLVVVILFGTSAKGSERWLSLGPFRLQPSEFTKLITVFFLTWYFTKVGKRIKKLHWFLITFGLVAIPIGLILKQPNLGTAACLGPLTMSMLYVAGCRKRHLAMIMIMGMTLLPMLWWQMRDFDPETQTEPRVFFELRHYQKMRIYTYLHPEYDPSGSGWHTLQSRITIGSGGLSGKGYMQGTQTRLNYLPEHHTDFIYSLLAEEFGFVGAVAVIALFLLLLLRGLSFAYDSVDMQGTLIATGVTTIFAFHIFVNIAITTGLLPVTGIPLPFLSYGGSFYMTTMAGIGILLSVRLRKQTHTHTEMYSPIGHVAIYGKKK
ncbi:MAG TPA: rod shape-determining protein RodA [Candidatus Hydrogenedentes bacterium]|nr:rod shape-determining protein RodA [Candidatus Hydrogenedentota bacterium]